MIQIKFNCKKTSMILRVYMKKCVEILNAETATINKKNIGI